ncbi:MAG: response regulator transcription factor [Clostridium sp.]
MTKILIADDNKQITSILEEYSKNEGYIPLVAFDGDDAINKFNFEKPDIVLLDVMMPKKDGFEVCRTIRKVSNVPIIMVTARGEDFEKIMGLDIGADDYIVKPFSPSEVMARTRAILRRVNKSDERESKSFEFNDLKININNYKVSLNNIDIPLTKKELEILWTLATNKGKVFSRDNLLNNLWGYEYLGDSRTVDSHIKRLRSKLDEFEHKTWDIKTIWGVGYKFEVTSNV